MSDLMIPQNANHLIPAHFANRRYYAYNHWVKAHYGGRIQKVSLEGGFTCPNRDGTRGTGGCTFCNNRSFTPGYLFDHKDIETQLELGLEFLKRRYPQTRYFVAYFQAYSNTYADINYLRQLYERVLAHPDINGLVIGTRPDCLPDHVLDYLAELAQKYIVELEIGIESCNEVVLSRCNRGHSFAVTEDALVRAAQRNLFVTGHLLFGLPGETRQTAVDGANRLAQLPIQSLKFHQLHIVKGTQLANIWRHHPEEIPLLDTDTYLEWVVDALERIPEQVIIQRLSSDVPAALRLIEDRGERIEAMSDRLDEVLLKRHTWQGRLFGMV